MYPPEFDSFYSPESIKEVMYKHWNEAPHRFGLFGENGKARPQYFVYQMLSRMGEEKLAASGPQDGIRSLAVQAEGKISVMVVNFNQQGSEDKIVKVCFDHLRPGLRRLQAYRIDEQQRWSDEALELLPYESRAVDVLPQFEYQFYSPADSVLLMTLEEAK